MESIEKLGAAIVFLGTGSGMVFFEWIRAKAGKPILSGNNTRQIYWMIRDRGNGSYQWR
jgi:uncharacterized membrane protein